MGHAAGQPADRLHLLGLAELLLQLLPLRDVPEHGQARHRPAVLEHAGHLGLREDVGAVPANDLGLEGPRGIPAGPGLVHAGLQGGRSLRSEQRERGAPAQLFLVVAGDLEPPWVAEHQVPLGVEQEHRVGDVLGHEAISLLRLEERLGEPLLAEGLLDRREEVAHLERLDQVRERQVVDGLDGGPERGVPGDEDDLHGGGQSPGGAQHVDAGHVGQADVHDGGLDRARGHDVETHPAPRGQLDHVPLALQHVAQGLGHPRIVVDDQDPAPDDHGRGPFADPSQPISAIRPSTCGTSSGLRSTARPEMRSASCTSSSRV